MIDDAELFTQLCKKHGIIAERDVIDAVKKSCLTGELRLAHSPIIVGICEVIAQVLSSSSVIKLVDLSDCMLLAKGLTSILKALCQGSRVTKLYLQGNNITGHLVEILGELLQQNSTLKVLHIEWNTVGAQVDSFNKFCNGLAKNNTLEELNLRYNQISTLCADSLSSALRVNKSLKKLDLAWNSLGLTGGQKIFDGIKDNKTVLSLNLNGNCIPSEIHSEIKNQILVNQRSKQLILRETSTLLNSSQEEQNNDCTNTRRKVKTKKLKRKGDTVKNSHNVRDSPVGDSGNEVDLPENPTKSLLKHRIYSDKDSNNSSCTNVETELIEKIKSLNKVVEEKIANINELKLELDAVKAEKSDLNTEIESLQEIKCKEIEEIKRSVNNKEQEWKQIYNELNDKHENTLAQKQDFECKIRIYEKEIRKSSNEYQSLKEKFSAKVQNYEDLISENKVEFHKLKRDFYEKENKLKIENNALKETLKEITSALEKNQEQLHKLRNELREANEINLKLKLKIDESEAYVSRAMKVEDALQRLKNEKDKLEDKLQESKKAYVALQNQLIKTQEESIEPQKRYDSIKLELKIEKEKFAALKQDFVNERGRMQEQNNQIQKLLSQINDLYAQISKSQSENAKILQEKDSEIEKLKNDVAQRKKNFQEYKSEQFQLAQQCHAALTKYLGAFTSNAMS